MQNQYLRGITVACFTASLLFAAGCSDGSDFADESVEAKASKAESVAKVIEANQRKALGNHHEHMSVSSNQLTSMPTRLRTPAAPDYARRFDGQYRAIRRQQGRVVMNKNLTAQPPVSLSGNCVLDFATPNLMQYYPGGATYWADRTKIPWLRDCGQNARLDLRWSKYGHMHVGFTDPDIGFCSTDPDGTASYIDEEGNCDILDLNTLERSYVSSHGWDEVLVLRANYKYSTEWTPFDLKRIRIIRDTGARVCYRKSGEPDSEGPWIIGNGQGTGTSSSMPGGWYCWKHLGQGYWDLSAWANDVIAVKITGSATTPSTFSIDDIHAVVH